MVLHDLWRMLYLFFSFSYDHEIESAENYKTNRKDREQIKIQSTEKNQRYYKEFDKIKLCKVKQKLKGLEIKNVYSLVLSQEFHKGYHHLYEHDM